MYQSTLFSSNTHFFIDQQIFLWSLNYLDKMREFQAIPTNCTTRLAKIWLIQYFMQRLCGSRQGVILNAMFWLQYSDKHLKQIPSKTWVFARLLVKIFYSAWWSSCPSFKDFLMNVFKILMISPRKSLQILNSLFAIHLLSSNIVLIYTFNAKIT